MIIHNATFMIEKEREGEFVKWLAERLDSVIEPPALNPRVSAMREAGGVDYRQAEAQSVAFQLEFPTLETARDWSSRKFGPLAAEFAEAFGPNAMAFTSLFETIRL